MVRVGSVANNYELVGGPFDGEIFRLPNPVLILRLPFKVPNTPILDVRDPASLSKFRVAFYFYDEVDGKYKYRNEQQ